VAVVGGGWAGSGAAVRACADGHAVTLYEMAPQLGGRARSVTTTGSRWTTASTSSSAPTATRWR
jgi:uncharacterized protein with NAD-binding domain and iron-sulfur cluster